MSAKVDWCKVCQIDPTQVDGVVTRAGIIPYTRVGKKIMLCLGQDRVHKELTDFGGGYSVRRDIHPAHCAVRELKEESLELFSPRVDEILNDNCIIYDDIIIIFHRIGYDDAVASSDRFHRLLEQTQADTVEVDDIQWIYLSHLHDLINSKRLYQRVATVLDHVMSDLVAKLKN